MRYFCIPYFITNSLYNLKNIIILLYKKLSKLSISYYDTHKKGDITSRITNDIETISTLLKACKFRNFSNKINYICVRFFGYEQKN